MKPFYLLDNLPLSHAACNKAARQAEVLCPQAAAETGRFFIYGVN
jgi:hypothetical protein